MASQKVISSLARSAENRISVAPEDHDPAAIMGGLYGDGIIALKGAFRRGGPTAARGHA